MVKLRMYQVDAFADQVFRGNPAAVVPLEQWLDDSQLQAIAAVSLWWLYFEGADSSVINQALQSSQKLVLLRSYVYGYSHVLVFAGIVAAGVGIQTAIEGADTGPLTVTACTVLRGGISLSLIGLSIVQWAAARLLPNKILGRRILAAIACGGLAEIGRFLAPVALMVLLTLILVGVIWSESHITQSA